MRWLSGPEKRNCGRGGAPTQEDPIGVAGGLNLYEFNGNNPVAYTDPFGLKVCYKGSTSEVESLRKGSEEATGSQISLDSDNCVREVKSNGNKKYDKIRKRFQDQVDADDTYTIQYDASGTHYYWYYDETNRSANILPGDVGTSYNTGRWYAPCWLTGGIYDTPPTLGALIAHELIGHGGGGGPRGEPNAINWENQYHGAGGQPQRCGGN